MPRILRSVVIEFATSFALGGLPAIILYFSAGVSSLEQLVSGIPDGFPLWYIVAISAIAFVILLCVRLRSRKKPSGIVMDVLLELHDQLHGVYRFAAGFLLTFVGIWHIDDCGSVDNRAWIFIIFGALSYLICIFYAAGTSYIEDPRAAA